MPGGGAGSGRTSAKSRPTVRAWLMTRVSSGKAVDTRVSGGKAVDTQDIRHHVALEPARLWPEELVYRRSAPTPRPAPEAGDSCWPDRNWWGGATPACRRAARQCAAAARHPAACWPRWGPGSRSRCATTRPARLREFAVGQALRRPGPRHPPRAPSRASAAWLDTLYQPRIRSLPTSVSNAKPTGSRETCHPGRGGPASAQEEGLRLADAADLNSLRRRHSKCSTAKFSMWEPSTQNIPFGEGLGRLTSLQALWKNQVRWSIQVGAWSDSCERTTHRRCDEQPPGRCHHRIALSGSNWVAARPGSSSPAPFRS